MIYDCCVRQKKCRSILRADLHDTILSHATSSRQAYDMTYDCRSVLRADLHDTILSHAASSRQAYDMTYDCRSVLKHVLKCYDIFSDVHNNRKSCRGPVVSRCRMRQSRTV